MSVKLRMARHGAKKQPFFRIVATDHRNPRDGRYIENLGTYDSRKNPPEVKMDMERVQYWLDNGAQASDLVAQVIRKAKDA